MDKTYPTNHPVETTYLSPEYRVRSPITGIIAAVLLFIGLIFHIFSLLTTRKARRVWRGMNERPVPDFLLSSLLKIDFCAVIFFLVRGFLTPIQVWSPTLLCNFAVSTSLFFTTASGLTNAVMCFERCFALMTPFGYRKHATMVKAKITLYVCLGVSVVFSILPFFGLSSYKYEQDGVIICVSPGDLTFDIDFILFHTILFFILGFSIVFSIVVCNFVVVFFILRLQNTIVPITKVPMNVAKSASGEEDSSSKGGVALGKDGEVSTIEDSRQRYSNSHHIDAQVAGQSRHDLQLAGLFIGVSVIYTISWLPLYLERLLSTFQVDTPEILYSCTIGLLTLNHVVDPVLFVFFKRKNQQALKLLLLQACCWCYPNYRKRIESSTMSVMLSYMP